MLSALRLSSNILKAPSTLKLLGRIHPVSTMVCNRFLNTRKLNDRNIPMAQDLTKITLSKPPLSSVDIYSTAVRSMTSSSVEKSGLNHGRLWSNEKHLSIALIFIVPLGVVFPNTLLDLMMAVSIVLHIHWGVEAIASDYIRPIIFGKIVPKIAVGVVYVISVLTLVGLLNLTFQGSGIGNTIQAIWSL